MLVSRNTRNSSISLGRQQLETVEHECVTIKQRIFRKLYCKYPVSSQQVHTYPLPSLSRKPSLLFWYHTAMWVKYREGLPCPPRPSLQSHRERERRGRGGEGGVLRNLLVGQEREREREICWLMIRSPVGPTWSSCMQNSADLDLEWVLLTRQSAYDLSVIQMPISYIYIYMVKLRGELA